MKMRGIKPESWTDSRMLRLTPLARWLFVGMWTIACDNGHVEHDPVELKVRLLPMDQCDVNSLLSEMVTTGQITVKDGWIKVKNLAKHQKVDLRYLTLCEHCKDDPHAVYTEGDRRLRGKSQRVPDVHPAGTQGAPATEGEGEGEGEGESNTCTSTDVDDAFEQWWKLYPRKVGKGQAKRAFRSSLKKTDLESLKAAITGQADHLMRRGPEFCPYPATWLNGERWLDAQPDGEPSSKPASDGFFYDVSY